MPAVEPPYEPFEERFPRSKLLERATVALGGLVALEGHRPAGPAPRALDRYQFSIRNGRLWLGRPYSVSRVEGTGGQARIASYPLQGDGQPVTGLESWLYPLTPPS